MVATLCTRCLPSPPARLYNVNTSSTSAIFIFYLFLFHFLSPLPTIPSHFPLPTIPSLSPLISSLNFSPLYLSLVISFLPFLPSVSPSSILLRSSCNFLSVLHYVICCNSLSIVISLMYIRKYECLCTPHSKKGGGGRERKESGDSFFIPF